MNVLFQDMTRESLVQLLSQNTEKLTHFFISQDFGDEYLKCKAATQEIQDLLNKKPSTDNPDGFSIKSSH
jgi:hypothetical protein